MADPNNIQADVPYRAAIAERGKFFPIDTDYLTSIGYPASGEGKYAILTYSINSGSGSTDTLSAESIPGDVAGPTVLQLGAIAETTVPAAVNDGDAVALWVDEYGRLVPFGANMSLNALDVNNINDPILSRLGPITNLNAVTATGSGASVDVSNYHNFTIHIVSSAVTTGATVVVEQSIDGVNWAEINTLNIAADGVNEVSISNQAYRYLRTSLITRIDGTYSTYIYAGN